MHFLLHQSLFDLLVHYIYQHRLSQYLGNNWRHYTMNTTMRLLREQCKISLLKICLIPIDKLYLHLGIPSKRLNL